MPHTTFQLRYNSFAFFCFFSFLIGITHLFCQDSSACLTNPLYAFDNGTGGGKIPYDSQAVLDLLTKAGKVPEALARRLRGELED